MFTERGETVLGGPFLVMGRIEGRVPSDDPPYTTQGWVLGTWRPPSSGR